MNLKMTLRALATVILEEADRNPQFAQRLLSALGDVEGEGRFANVNRLAPKTPRARPAAVLDPIAILGDHGEQALRRALGPLGLDKLLDIVAEFAMDPSKLVMKWKNTE